MEYLFGKKIRALREAQGLLQRQVAYHLDIDSPMLSNIERGDRRAKREWIPKLAKLLKVSEEELLTYWLADRVNELVQDEKVGKETIKTVAEGLGIKLNQKKVP
jgi:transcriptional regulator with XRE-family HTH domain